MIVEDRDSMASMLKRALMERGMDIEEATSVDEALAYFRGEALALVLLDTSVDGGDGLRFVSEAARDEKRSESDRKRRKEYANGAGIVVIHRPYETVPNDCMRVRGDLTLPFTEAELKKAVDRAIPKLPNGESDPPESWGVSLSDPGSDLVGNGVPFGESYVFFKESQSAVHEAMKAFSMAGYGLLLITVARPKVARERFGLDQGAEVLTLSGSNYGLGTMVVAVEEFIRRTDYPVIALDDLDNIIYRCGTDMAMRFISEVESCGGDKRKTLLVSLNGDLISPNIRAMLSSMMVTYEKRE